MFINNHTGIIEKVCIPRRTKNSSQDVYLCVQVRGYFYCFLRRFLGDSERNWKEIAEKDSTGDGSLFGGNFLDKLCKTSS